jgi:SanA protein
MHMTKQNQCVAILGGGAAAVVIALFGAQFVIGRVAPNILEVNAVPKHNVALVLGCSPRLFDGSENLYFRNRIRCAADLYRNGKVNRFLVSGDNSRKNYDEPTAMRDALVASGVPVERIVLDYAGFSTLDSIVRAKEVFGQTQLVVVSQRDHAMRAVYIAKAKGIQALGVPAEDVGFGMGFRTDCREALARVRTILDVWVWGRTPKFLGPRIEIPDG